VQRLWLQSMTPQAIREGFEHLRSDEQMQPLADAARSRSEADWLVGINGTRAMTAFNSRDGGFFLDHGGPRADAHAVASWWSARSRSASSSAATTGKSRPASSAAGRHTRASGSTPTCKEDPSDAETPRRPPVERGRRRRPSPQAVRGQPATVTEESQAQHAGQPAAVRPDHACSARPTSRFGFSAKTTLSLAQALYEKHKVLTYPRTDSRAPARRLPGRGEATPWRCWPTRTCPARCARLRATPARR
jgi:DNA topoisomerase-3